MNIFGHHEAEYLYIHKLLRNTSYSYNKIRSNTYMINNVKINIRAQSIATTFRNINGTNAVPRTVAAVNYV